MKITIITPPCTGGTAVHTQALVNTLVERGHELRIITVGGSQNGSTQLSHDGVRLSWPTPAWNQQRKMSYWNDRLRGLPTDSCVLVKNCFGIWPLALLKTVRQYFARSLIIEHLIAPPWPQPTLRRNCRGMLPGLGLRWYLRYPHEVARARCHQKAICVSRAVKRRLHETYRCPEERLQVIPNAVDTKRFRPDARRRLETRAAWGIEEHCTVFGAIGRMAHAKGFDLTIRAVSRLARECEPSRFRFVLVGDGPEKQSLMEQSERLGCRQAIRFEPPTSAPEQLYPAIDYFMMPSRAEGMPLTLLEAMACECVPIASDVDGIPEVLSNDALGWLTSPENVHDLQEAMQCALEWDCAQRKATGRQARAHIQNHFDIVGWKNAFVNAIEST